MPPDVGVLIGSCALTRSIVDRRRAPPFNRSVSRHDGSQDRFRSQGLLALVVALGLGARAGSRWVDGGRDRGGAGASVFGARGCGCGSTGPKAPERITGTSQGSSEEQDERYEH